MGWEMLLPRAAFHPANQVAGMGVAGTGMAGTGEAAPGVAEQHQWGLRRENSPPFPSTSVRSRNTAKAGYPV